MNEQCTRCFGRGYLPEARPDRPGFYARTCPPCRGAGSIATIKVERVPLDRQGYDRRGRYFGVGAALYRYETPEGERYAIEYVRGTYQGARRAAQRAFPGVKVLR